MLYILKIVSSYLNCQAQCNNENPNPNPWKQKFQHDQDPKHASIWAFLCHFDPVDDYPIRAMTFIEAVGFYQSIPGGRIV